MDGNTSSQSIGNVRDLTEIDLRRLIEYLKVSHPSVLKEAMEAMYLRPYTDNSASGVGTTAATTATTSANRRPCVEVTAEVTEIETTTTLSSIMQDPDPPVMISRVSGHDDNDDDDDDVIKSNDDGGDDDKVIRESTSTTMMKEETEEKIPSSIVTLEKSVKTTTQTIASTGDLSQKTSKTGDVQAIGDTSQLASNKIEGTDQPSEEEGVEEDRVQDHYSAATEIEELQDTNAEQVTNVKVEETMKEAKDNLSQTTMTEKTIQETQIEEVEELKTKQENDMGENIKVTSEKENGHENIMPETSTSETRKEVPEIDISEPANNIENVTEEPYQHNQESTLEVGSMSMSASSKEESKLNEEPPSMKKKIPPKPADSEKGCYLVYDSSSNGRLMIYYSKTAVPHAVGFWAPSPKHTIQGFKFKRNMGRSELIGNCAAGVTGRKNYYSGWCQFIRAAKALDGTVTVFPRMENEGLDVDIYAYFKPPYEVDGHQTIQLEENVPFKLEYISAVACLPRHSTLFDEFAKIELSHWMTVSNKVGACTSFADSESAPDAAFMAHLMKGKNYQPTKYDTASLKSATKYDTSLLKSTRTNSDSPPLWEDQEDETSSSSSSENNKVKFEVTTKPPVPMAKKSKAFPPTIPASFMDDSEFQQPTPEEVSISKAHTGCYLVYNLDGAKLMVHYSKIPVPNALGFWQPSNKYKIQGFKFKQNYGKNDLQTNCASGVTGRKNYYSGICQFIRMAKNLDGTVYLYNKGDKPGLDVDVYVYYDDMTREENKKPQTFKVEHETAFHTGGIQAVTCLPKHADFYEDNMTIDLNHWMTKASAIGAASRFVA